MINIRTHTLLFTSIFTLAFAAQAQDTIIIDDNFHHIEITEVTYNINGQTIVQNNPSNTENYTTSFVDIENIEVTSNNFQKDLSFFNSATNVTNINYPNDVSGVSVYEDGNDIYPNNNQQNFADAIRDMSKNNNILHMLRVDGASNLPSGADYDMILEAPMDSNHYLVFAERNGQSDMYLHALDADGNIIADANVIRIAPSFG